MRASGTRTTPGTIAEISVRPPAGGATAEVSLWGSFSGTVKLQRYYSHVGEWLTIREYTDGAEEDNVEVASTQRLRLELTSIASGEAKGQIASAAPRMLS